MAKKQFIRHLEYYGFPDQNQYTSEFNGVDLSDIRQKNKEQDEEIGELETDKADKKSLNELSGTVENLIAAQSEVNEEFAEAISGITSDIGKLKEIDNEYGEQLSALTDSLNDVIEDVNELDDKVDDINGDIEELSGKVETLSAETEEKFNEVSEELDKKLDKSEAEETYAKKDECVTREYLDERLEPYATKEWIQESGYMTQEQADDRYAKKETVDALSDRLNDAVTDLNTKIYTVSGDLQSFSSVTNNRMGVIETNFETLRGETDRKINAISAAVDTFDSRITQNEEDIEDLEDDLARKANQADLENLQSKVSNLSDVVDAKVGKPEFEAYKSSVANQFNNMDNKKADKSAFTQAMDAIEDANNRLDQEIENRIAGDANLQNQIDALDGEVDALSEEVEGFDGRISAVEDGLAQEIIDRKQADLDLIGTEGDDKDDDTIWGAKNYAKWQKTIATREANAYTDSKVTEINSRIDQEHEWAEQNFSSAASKAYVESMINEAESELETEITNAVNEESDRATAAEEDLLRRIIEVLRALGENDRLLDLLTNRVNAITAWDGTDPDEYDNTGNGVLDVLHREFHEFEKTGGSIKEIRVEGDNLIIAYYTKDGEKETVISIGELIDLDNYYNKQETDALLAEKLDVSAYTDISEQVTANTQNIAILSGAVQDEADRASSAETVLDEKIDAEVERAVSAETELQNTISETGSALDALINKLGYTDNDTLVRNGDHEAAFGQYNISNTSEDASGRTLFSIGNGTDDENRSNALEVKENGDVYLWIEGEFMNINKLLGQIAHEVYDNDSTHNSHFFDGN
jgi:chromosome segregation ATPase